jgi:hypothetical protein
MSHHVFGIRHHGPGSARALRTALSALGPDVLLVEGPPDANGVLSLLSDERLVPPVALLVHALDNPQRAVFYPFAIFSPEWQALQYAARSGIPARFIDLPCAHTLAARAPGARGEDQTDEAPEEEPLDAEEQALRDDPIGMLAEAAGYRDRERWWDLQVEQRVDATGLFEGLLEAMSALREQHEEKARRELQREAHMRSMIRAAHKEGFARIAVVCGAWHAPRLVELGPARADQQLLKGLPKTKVGATWVPWTYSRLSYRSGYGAGVDSPGWYAHLWQHGHKADVVWATRAARLLREQDLDASSANVIETVRLASALAALRDAPVPGLGELRESIAAVLAGGQPARLALIRKQLEIGEALGEVPEHAGQVPIWRDFEQQSKRLRLPRSAELKTLALDLRKDTDRERSHLLHRLAVLDVEWGSSPESGQGAGTFRETFQLCWQPELAVELIAANSYGNTIEVAAANKLSERARNAELPELTRLTELALQAALPRALDALLAELDARAASSSDVRAQMEAVEPLARVARYGDVRGTRAEHVLPVLRALFERIVVGLFPACTQLDDEAAAALVRAIGTAHRACLLLEEPALRSDWLEALSRLADGAPVHPRVRGRTARLLLEQRVLTAEELARRASLALGAAVEPAHAAQWIEGLVEGEGVLLVHQEELLAVLDRWLESLGEDQFQAQLPLLRRGFSGLAPAERRSVARQMKAAAPGRAPKPAHAAEPLDPERVARVVPVLAQLLGVDHA